MEFSSFIPLSVSLVTLCMLLCSSPIRAQQPYIGRATTACSIASNSSSELGYTCNGVNKTCQAYLIYRSRSPFNTVSSISQLLASDPSQLAAINSVPKNSTFDLNKMVIVPVNCSCSGQYYQVNATYTIRSGDNYYLIVNQTYQGLTTCKAIKNENDIETVNLYSGTLTIPIRCACPTKNQTARGAKYLLSYVVARGDYVSRISLRFGANTGRTLDANGLSEQYSTIYPSTTLLVPMQNPPSSNQTIAPPSPPQQTPPPPQSPSPSSSNRSSRNKWIFSTLGFFVGISCALTIAVLFFCTIFRPKQRAQDPTILPIDSRVSEHKKPTTELGEESHGLTGRISSIAQSIKVFNLEELLIATDNFSPNNWIKGSVHRGEIEGTVVAVKKMHGDAIKEINLLNKINHVNIVRLSGICFDDGIWYFVYEYVCNGSLCDWIYNTSDDGRVLSWTQRIQIALSVATGLHYLHSFTSPPHIHKNITSSNVLLDSDFRAKITNLGFARSAQGGDGELALTSHIIGTKGYMAPEYLENGLISTKLDVYAFGILMMEMITGKDAESLLREANMNLHDALDDMVRADSAKERLLNLIDPSLRGNYPPNLAISMVGLSQCCLDKNLANRPAMDEIVQPLSGLLASSIAWECSNHIM